FGQTVSLFQFLLAQFLNLGLERGHLFGATLRGPRKIAAERIQIGKALVFMLEAELGFNLRGEVYLFSSAQTLFGLGDTGADRTFARVQLLDRSLQLRFV